ncbi:G-patch domain-containing protein [Mycena kentingensis (nom. inval.)]|nr:G-patch domain-containing protein [Mycena kentingensis (nom. inval.)]
MATTTHFITSYYDPADRERLERETGQYDNQEDAWAAEAQRAFKRRIAPPPRFVPASASEPSTEPREVAQHKPNDVGGWYRSLARSKNNDSNAGPSVAAGTTPILPPPSQPRALETRTKNNWFIMNAIQSEPATEPLLATSATIADILQRDPPPLPHERQHKPPIWLALGPGNRGFSMLQSSGWSEGEALGVGVARQPKRLKPTHANEDVDQVIDLTVDSDDDVEELEDDVEDASAEDQMDEDEVDGRTALKTPLGVVLKSDRLGIGLKAKTVGPYKESQKRVTPNARALAAHMRASEELRKEKRKNGRGHRGFARQATQEASNRRALLAYMNS